jgi:HsdM N-terminal domain
LLSPIDIFKNAYIRWPSLRFAESINPVALKKSELYSSLWSGCDELRGGMDASQYKDYVLVMLFIKYVSDKYAGVAFAPITIPAGSSFVDLVALKGTADIGDAINKKIIAPLFEKCSLRLRSGNTLALAEGYVHLSVPKDGIKTAIFEHPEFVAFSTVMAELFAEWRSRSALMLKGLDVGCQPKLLISKLAEDLLDHYVGKDLIDRYDIY